MDLESENTKTTSRSSSVEDIVSESQNDDQSAHGSESPSSEARHSSIGDADNEPDLFESQEVNESFPIHQSCDSSWNRPVSYVSPLVSEPRTESLEEEFEVRHTPSPESKSSEDIAQHEDDGKDKVSSLVDDNEAWKPVLVTSDGYTDKSDLPIEHLVSLDREARSVDQLEESQSEADDEPLEASGKSINVIVHKESDSTPTSASPVMDDSADTLDSPREDLSTSEQEAERKTPTGEDAFSVSDHSAFVPISHAKEASHDQELFDGDTSEVPTPLHPSKPSVKGSSNEKIMTTKHGIRIKVYVGDITKANAEAVVTSESPYQNDMSMVTRALCNAPGGSELKEKRERRQLIQGTLTYGKVYTVHMKNEQFPFQYVLQAIISQYDTSEILPKEWKRLLRVLYKNIYKKADKKDISSVAIPLLGTGRGHGSAEVSVEAAVRTLCKHRPLSLEEVQFVSLDRGVNDYLAAICESCCNVSDESSSDEDVIEEPTDEEPTQKSAIAGPLQSKAVSVSVSASLEPDNILFTSPPTGSQRPVALSSALLASSSDETSPRLTRAERMKQLMSQVEERQDTNSVSDSNNDEVLNVIPEVKSTLQAFDTKFVPTPKNTPPFSEEYGEGSANAPVNIIRESRRTYFSDHSDGVPFGDLHKSSKKKGQTSQSFWPPSVSQKNDSEDDIEDYGDGPHSGVYFNSETIPGRWRYSVDNMAEYGSDEDGYDKKCAEVEDDAFEIYIDANLVQTGNQPPGTMSVTSLDKTHLPGYEDAGTIVITYQIPSGSQTEDHPHPGKRYHGVHRRAFLPDNEAGKMILRMLKVAFERRLVFTVGRSLTTGQPDVVKWGPISHKTSQEGGPTRYGYPDGDYLNLVTNELLNLGIVDTASDVADDMNSLLPDAVD